MIIITTATALIQWVIRTQAGWIAGRAGAAGTTAVNVCGFDRHGPPLRGRPITNSPDRVASHSCHALPVTLAGSGLELRAAGPAGCMSRAAVHASLRRRVRSSTNFKSSSMSKANSGNFFENFRIGQVIRHATPRTVTVGDVALYNGLFGARFAVQSSDAFAHGDRLSALAGRRPPGVPHRVRQDRAGRLAQRGRQPRLCQLPLPGAGLSRRHAQRGVRGDRAEGKFQPQDRHRVRALVRLQAGRQQGARICALGDGAQAATRRPPPRPTTCRACPIPSTPSTLGDACPPIDVAAYDFTLAGSPARFGDYAVGDKIDHVDGVTVEEAEHMIATRLYQNTARIHFNQFAAAQDRFGRRLIYGGHVISLARALSFNGLANAFHIAAINGGRHVAPLFAGATVFAWSEVTGQRRAAGTVATSARCACAPSPPRTGRARTSRTSRMAQTILPCCSISTTGC